MLPNQLPIGMRVAARVFDEWDRAEVIGEVSKVTGKVKLFFLDYGTTGFVGTSNCKMLVEDFAVVPRMAIRAALYGVQPLNGARLWSLQTTNWFITKIRNKAHRIRIIKYHEIVSLNKVCYDWLILNSFTGRFLRVHPNRQRRRFNQSQDPAVLLGRSCS